MNTASKSAAGFLRLCPLCDKACTRGLSSIISPRRTSGVLTHLAELSYTRHVKYCRNAQATRKGRPKSCAACSASKTKCSFAKPRCSRCDSKGLQCIYEQSKSRVTVATTRSEFLQSPRTLQFDQPLDAAWTTNWSPAEAESDLALDLNANALDFSQQQTVPFSDFTRNDTICGQTVSPLTSASTSIEWLSQPSPSDLQTASASNIIFPPDSATLVHLRHGNPASKHAASLLSNIIFAFPQMMLRRQTFPPFIHGYWHAQLPEKLVACMSIAQLFAARTPETRPFLWRMIDAEEQRFRDEVYINLTL